MCEQLVYILLLFCMTQVIAQRADTQRDVLPLVSNTTAPNVNEAGYCLAVNKDIRQAKIAVGEAEFLWWRITVTSFRVIVSPSVSPPSLIKSGYRLFSHLSPA